MVNADLFNAIFSNTTFQKIPIPHLTGTMTQNAIFSLMSTSNLLKAIFGQHDFFPGPKVALTKELVYYHMMIMKKLRNHFIASCSIKTLDDIKKDGTIQLTSLY